MLTNLLNLFIFTLSNIVDLSMFQVLFSMIIFYLIFDLICQFVFRR